MANTNHKFYNCKGDVLKARASGSGSITVKYVTLDSITNLTAPGGTSLSITGGVHSLLTVDTSLYNNVVSSKTRDWYSGGNENAKEGEVASVEIGDNVHTFFTYISSYRSIRQKFYDTARVNLHLRGTWAMQHVHLWGNLGFDLETKNTTPMNNVIFRAGDTLEARKALGFPEEVPEVILRNVNASYNLWFLLNEFTPKARQYVFNGTLKTAQQVLRSGCTINQFCAFKDIHTNPHCRCALYYPLLFERNSLALAYFLRAAEHTKQHVPTVFESIPNKQIEDALDKVVLAHEGDGTWYRTLKGSDIEPTAFARGFSKPRFMAFLKSVGITDASVLWRAPEPE